MLVIKTQLHSTILNNYISFSTFKGTVSLSNMNLNKHNHNKTKKQNEKNIEIKSTWLEN